MNIYFFIEAVMPHITISVTETALFITITDSISLGVRNPNANKYNSIMKHNSLISFRGNKPPTL
jgi:hypothetical protein